MKSWDMPTGTVTGLSVSMTVPPEVRADSYQVNWGDGTVDYWGSEDATASHTYTAAGTYTVRVDPYGAQYSPKSGPVTVAQP